VDVFTVVCGGLLAFFVITTLLLGLFSKRSALDVLQWRPTRSRELEASNEVDDVAQMIAAQNELRARRGKPPRTREQVERDIRDERAELERWRAS
jgi:hypothetical protein